MLINRNLIMLDAEFDSKDDAIEKIAKLFESEGYLNDLAGYIQAVKQRELEISTNLGDGIGMPHARSNTVKKAGLVFVRLKNPIQWDGDNSPISVIFGIAVPESGGNLHLKLLAQLARNLIYDEFKEKIFKIENKDALLELIKEATKGVNE